MYCKGADTCSNGTCTPHAGNPCKEEGDGDVDCTEACDEDNNDCSRPDEPGSPCPDDSNPCTTDECSGYNTGECLHVPGNAGAVCGPPQDDRHAERTCTGASIVCPSTSISLDELERQRELLDRQRQLSEQEERNFKRRRENIRAVPHHSNRRPISARGVEPVEVGKVVVATHDPHGRSCSK